MRLNKYYVYLHLKETNGEPFYVGKGKNRRAFNLKYRNNIWNKVKDKYGIDIIILENNLTEKEALNLERILIKRIGRIDLKTGPLANLTDGGETNDNISPSTRKFLSDRMIGNTLTKGITRSKESSELTASKIRGIERPTCVKDKLSKAQSLNKGDKACNKKMVLNINTGIYYTSAKEAAIIYGLDYKNLNYNLNKEDQSKNNTHIIYV